jgi:hypothetical protein
VRCTVDQILFLIDFPLRRMLRVEEFDAGPHRPAGRGLRLEYVSS